MATVSFEKLVAGQKYDRPYLADIWGYKGHEAISRGLVTPAGTNYIILFITEEKQAWDTPYKNYIDDDHLYIDGQDKHGSDSRIVGAIDKGDEIHLFYRERHRDQFEYYGQIALADYTIHSDKPSEFIFSLNKASLQKDPLADIEAHQHEFSSLPETEQKKLRKSRLGQGEFRKRLLKLWGECSVTGVANPKLLRASHIKPWSESSNAERLDPLNGLLLTPSLDHLFDAGFITFDALGKIVISKSLSDKEQQILGLSHKMSLRKNISGIAPYLDFHRRVIFKN